MSVDNVTLSATLEVDGNTTALGSSASPFSGLTQPYQALLQSASYLNNTTDPLNLTVTGLTIGQTYQVQVWVNDSRQLGGSPRSETLAPGDTTSLRFNSTSSEGGLGQFAIGTFVADSSSQTITIVGASTAVPDVFPSPQINAFQLRAIGPSIHITLAPSPSQSNAYVITAAPAMPQMGAKAKVAGVTPDPTMNTTFHWQTSLTLKDVSPAVSYDQDIQQKNLVTTGEQLIPVTFKDSTAFRGGTLKFTATAIVNGNSMTGTLDNIEIQGENPLRTSVQAYIDTVVPSTGSSGLAATDIADALKRLACQESSQKQFDAPADGGVGPVLLSCDGGAGVFQITRTGKCPDPFTNCANVVFNWQANTQEGWNAFKAKINYAKAYPKALASSPEYANYIQTVINPQRIAANLSPITGQPAPAFLTTGQIGSNPPNQLLEDAVRGYNGYGGALLLNGQIVYDSEGNTVLLHEFIPDQSYLPAVPDSTLKGLNKDPKVWRRVQPNERPAIGERNYVRKVINHTPGCAPFDISGCAD